MNPGAPEGLAIPASWNETQLIASRIEYAMFLSHLSPTHNELMFTTQTLTTLFIISPFFLMSIKPQPLTTALPKMKYYLQTCSRHMSAIRPTLCFYFLLLTTGTAH